MNLQEWLSHCERLHPQNIDMGLERVAAVTKKMGLQFTCPVITVAGTNGKGSTCAMLECILREAGYRTGMFTSPHLVFFEERCKLNGQAASASVLAEHFAKVEAIPKTLYEHENGKQEVREDRRIFPCAGLCDLLAAL